MANIEKKVVFELTNDEKCWFAFANLGLAEISHQLENEEMDYLMNSETGEIIEISDINKAFSVIDFLLEGKIEIKY